MSQMRLVCIFYVTFFSDKTVNMLFKAIKIMFLWFL